MRQSGRGTALLFMAVVLTLAAAGCGGGGGSSTPAAGTPSGTSSGATVGYVNPAWQAQVNPPTSYWPASPGPTQPSMAAWFNARSWLLDRSTWQNYLTQGNQPDRGAMGVFGLGNGRVFGMVGMSYPMNTIHGMCGPRYSGGYFGDVAVGLELYPRKIVFDEEWLWKARRSATAITKARSSELELYTVDFAPPGVEAICRVIIAKNPTAHVQTSVNAWVNVVGTTTAETPYRLVQDHGARRLTVGATGAPLGASVDASGQLKIQFGDLAAGEEKTALLYMVMSDDEARRQAEIVTIQSTGADRLLESTRQWWDAFFNEGASFELPDQKVKDWIDDFTVTLATQLAENGCASPMSRYTSTWMRDQEGAFRVFLRQGRPEAVRRMLEAYYKTSILSGGIYNSMGADKDLSNVPAPPDWMQASFMPGRNAVEAPSYIPIEWYDFYKATGDRAFLAECYDYCKAAVLRQEVSPDGLMRFNGDEPFRWVMAIATALYEPENRGWSSNSAFLFVAAADRMAKVATLLGKTADAADFQQRADFVRAATEQHFWLPGQGIYDCCVLFTNLIPVGKPFEDITLMPLRIGYVGPKDPHGRANLLNAKQMLVQPDGFMQSPLAVSGLLGGLAVNAAAYDGMVPGYYLQNLTIVDHADAEKAFNCLGRTALCTGEICEGQLAGSHNALMLEYAADGVSLADIVARFRPWEGGLCVDAALQYLFGEDWDAPNAKVSVTPHVPNGWGAFAARGLKVNGQLYDVEVRDFGTRRLERVTNRSSAPLTVNLGASVVGVGIGVVRMDGETISQPPIDADLGRLSFRVERTVQPGDWLDLDFDYTR
ncbi:MAG TPA: hypothetical protein VHF22_05415 [Planctomycetota bacterium]|nr:hypothetical protein [Planctomycetota bacterium]